MISGSLGSVSEIIPITAIPGAFTSNVTALFGLLSAHPGLGPARPDLAADLRYFVVGRYLMLYREITGGIEIVRVLHSARYIPDLI